jgi:hypothetical protein
MQASPVGFACQSENAVARSGRAAGGEIEAGLRVDYKRAFRPARAGYHKFFHELNEPGWDLQQTAQKNWDAHFVEG